MMRQLGLVTRREFNSYFATPLAFVFIFVFLLATGLSTFYLGGYFEAGQADLTSFFLFHPWLYLFFCRRFPCACGPKNAATGRSNCC